MFILNCWSTCLHCASRRLPGPLESSNINPFASTHMGAVPEVGSACSPATILVATKWVHPDEGRTIATMTFANGIFSLEPFQHWTFFSGQLRHGSLCLAPPSPAYVGALAMMLPCSKTSDQLWEKHERPGSSSHAVSLVHRISNLCLDARNSQEITVQACNDDLPTQEFTLTRWVESLVFPYLHICTRKKLNSSSFKQNKQTYNLLNSFLVHQKQRPSHLEQHSFFSFLRFFSYSTLCQQKSFFFLYTHHPHFFQVKNVSL